MLPLLSQGGRVENIHVHGIPSEVLRGDHMLNMEKTAGELSKEGGVPFTAVQRFCRHAGERSDLAYPFMAHVGPGCYKVSVTHI